MADAPATSINGTYGSQYAQPAELAASTPSGPSHAQSASQSTSASATATKADPQEIGWYFVEQYYTTLSKSPERIHLFYNKKSQLVTGVEAEKVIPAVGAKAISEKIKSLDIQDCKVRVLNVDSQASFSNIVVQVIGEMSNKSEPHHKFVQTFVLAEQPNGYYVLNDIFRYLNDDEDEIVEDEIAQPEVPAEEPGTPVETEMVATAPEEVVDNPVAVEEVDEKLEEEQEQEDEQEQAIDTEIAPVNGIDEEKPAEEMPTNTETPEPVDAAAAAEEEPAVEESSTHDETEETASATIEPPKAATPIPEVPTKKTWASMVGGKAPAVPALPAQPAASSTAPVQPKVVRPPQPAQVVKPVSAASESSSAGAAPSPSNGWQTADHSKKAKNTQAKASEGVTLAYIKNVNEKVDARILREVLESFGELKYYDVSRPRNCAFVEFADPAGYAAAVAANPHAVGSEQIYVEERRPRPNAYGGSSANFTRGNGNAGRGGGGGGRGGIPRTGSQGSFPKDAGRGGFQQQRGGKSGNVTPKGRGQTQAA